MGKGTNLAKVDQRLFKALGNKMRASVVVTILNEEKTISALLNSLLKQTKEPNEIVIVDGGSEDKTVEIIRHFQKKDKRIKLLKEKCSRARGRNLGVEVTRNNILAVTDAGCIADKDWLKRITRPFGIEKVDIVAGFYDMVGDTPFQKALAVFIGVTPSKFDMNFLPSARSMAFRRELWERIGGFPEKLRDTAEDTVFNYKAIRAGANFARVKDARVEWRMPDTFQVGVRKIYNYAKGDVQSGLWWNPTKQLASHNIKILLVFLRYIVGLILLIYGFRNPNLWIVLLTGLIFYIFWAFRKVYKEFGNWKVGLWGIVLQFSSDFAVMLGFTVGIVKK